MGQGLTFGGALITFNTCVPTEWKGKFETPWQIHINI